MESVSFAKGLVLRQQQLSSLESKKVFFGHQSVGADIMQGVRDLMTREPRLKLNVVGSGDPQSVSGPAFVEATIGENGKPHSKDEAFAANVAKGIGAEGGIAMYKYCYVDIDSSTDAAQMFERYRAGISTLKSKYPLLKFVHITVPLTTGDLTMKAWIKKTLLGRPTARDANAKRHEFNELLRRTYSGADPIFDLAAVESTHPDGSRSYFMHGNEKIYTLAPEFTTDGGHLNETGRRVAAEQLLLLLAEL